eukprot:7386191-Prymnesium_polylepis.1
MARSPPLACQPSTRSASGRSASDPRTELNIRSKSRSRDDRSTSSSSASTSVTAASRPSSPSLRTWPETASEDESGAIEMVDEPFNAPGGAAFAVQKVCLWRLREARRREVVVELAGNRRFNRAEAPTQRTWLGHQAAHLGSWVGRAGANTDQHTVPTVARPCLHGAPWADGDAIVPVSFQRLAMLLRIRPLPDAMRPALSVHLAGVLKLPVATKHARERPRWPPVAAAQIAASLRLDGAHQHAANAERECDVVEEEKSPLGAVPIPPRRPPHQESKHPAQRPKRVQGPLGPHIGVMRAEKIGRAEPQRHDLAKERDLQNEHDHIHVEEPAEEPECIAAGYHHEKGEAGGRARDGSRDGKLLRCAVYIILGDRGKHNGSVGALLPRKGQPSNSSKAKQQFKSPGQRTK